MEWESGVEAPSGVEGQSLGHGSRGSTLEAEAFTALLKALSRMKYSVFKTTT